MSEVPDPVNPLAHRKTKSSLPKQSTTSHSSSASNTSKADASNTSKDFVCVTPISKWVEQLKNMAEPEMDPEVLAEIKKELPSLLEEEKFNEEVFPKIANELIRDWNVTFEKPK